MGQLYPLMEHHLLVECLHLAQSLLVLICPNLVNQHLSVLWSAGPSPCPHIHHSQEATLAWLVSLWVSCHLVLIRRWVEGCQVS